MNAAFNLFVIPEIGHGVSVPKLIIACPVKDRAWALPQWFDAIAWRYNELRTPIDLDIVCVYTESEDDTEKILVEKEVTILRDERPGRAVIEIDGHCWGSENQYAYMADMRNRIIEHALEADADYLLSLDSDIIMPSMGLQHLLDYAQTHEGVISPAVNMAWGSVAWNVMSWVDASRPNLVTRNMLISERDPVDVVMAAMLLDRRGMEARWVGHPAGEDVGFCIDAEQKGIKRWWLPSVRCDHLMARTEPAL